MKPPGPYLRGNVLPTVVVVSVLLLTALLGLVMLWEQESLLFARSLRLRQARADVESAYALYRLHPGLGALTALEGYLLYDSLPRSRVFLDATPWGLRGRAGPNGRFAAARLPTVRGGTGCWEYVFLR